MAPSLTTQLLTGLLAASAAIAAPTTISARQDTDTFAGTYTASSVGTIVIDSSVDYGCGTISTSSGWIFLSSELWDSTTAPQSKCNYGAWVTTADPDDSPDFGSGFSIGGYSDQVSGQDILMAEADLSRVGTVTDAGVPYTLSAPTLPPPGCGFGCTK